MSFRVIPREWRKQYTTVYRLENGEKEDNMKRKAVYFTIVASHSLHISLIFYNGNVSNQLYKEETRVTP